MEGAEEAAAGVGSEASVPLSWLGVRVDAGAPVGLSLWVPPLPTSQHPGLAAAAFPPQCFCGEGFGAGPAHLLLLSCRKSF